MTKTAVNIPVPMTTVLDHRVELVCRHDAEQISQYYQRNASHLRPWEPRRDKHHHSLEAWQERAAAHEKAVLNGSSYSFVVKDSATGTIIAVCNFSNVVRGAFQGCHLGYSIDHAQQGKGIMFSSLSTIIPVVFEHFKLHRIMANYMPRNVRSGQLLDRLGFAKEGYAKSYLRINGQWEDHILMSRLHP